MHTPYDVYVSHDTTNGIIVVQHHLMHHVMMYTIPWYYGWYYGTYDIIHALTEHVMSIMMLRTITSLHHQCGHNDVLMYPYAHTMVYHAWHDYLGIV